MTYKTGRKVYASSLDRINFATAAVTLLYTDTYTEEGYLGEDVESVRYFVSGEKTSKRILSSMDFYSNTFTQAGVTSTKSLRDRSFNILLSQRMASFAGISDTLDLPRGVIATADALNESIGGPMFHETFHHSEQALMHLLSSTFGLAKLISAAQSSKAAYLYGVVLDIYTQRMLCVNCNAALVGLQHSHETGFLHDLRSGLAKSQIQSREKLMLGVRVSASKAPKGVGLDALRLPTDAGVVHEYDPDLTTRVMQAENRVLGTQKIAKDEEYALSTYKGCFFTSNGQLSPKKLEREIAVPDAVQTWISF